MHKLKKAKGNALVPQTHRFDHLRSEHHAFSKGGAIQQELDLL